MLCLLDESLKILDLKDAKSIINSLKWVFLSAVKNVMQGYLTPDKIRRASPEDSSAGKNKM